MKKAISSDEFNAVTDVWRNPTTLKEYEFKIKRFWGPGCIARIYDEELDRKVGETGIGQCIDDTWKRGCHLLEEVSAEDLKVMTIKTPVKKGTVTSSAALERGYIFHVANLIREDNIWWYETHSNGRHLKVPLLAKWEQLKTSEIEVARVVVRVKGKLPDGREYRHHSLPQPRGGKFDPFFVESTNVYDYIGENDEIKIFRSVSEKQNDYKCDFCGKMGNWKSCGGCKKVKYCGRKCQKKHWKSHKAECKIKE